MNTRRLLTLISVLLLLVLGAALLRQPGVLGLESAARQQGLGQLLGTNLVEADLFDDPDFPGFAEGLLDESSMLQLRDEHLFQLRGAPDDFSINARAEAILEMNRQEATLLDTGLVPEATWSFIGPAPLPNGQTTSVATPVSGRTTAIAVHPTNPAIAYVGTAQGGLYRTLDGGTTWTQLMESALSLAIGAVTMSPTNPSTLYVGTGEAHSSCDSFFGVGVYVITNADTSPVLNGPFNQDGGGTDVFSGRSISRILVDPGNPNTIFLGTYSGIGGIGCTRPAIQPPAGLYRSNNILSGAPTFSKLTVATDNGGDNRVTDLIFEPGNANIMLVGVRAASGPSGGGIYRSTNALAANPTFTKVLDLNTIRVEFDINKVGATVTVLAATEESGGTLRKSTDGGTTWPTILTGANGFCGGQCWYDIGLAMDPANANIIYIGGASNSGAARILAKSTDGQTFQDIDTGMHADTHDIVLAPSNSSVVWVGSDGGIWRSIDSGGSFTSLNNNQFSATQFQSLALHPTDANFMIGGTQDNGTPCLGVCGANTNPNSWIRADWGDGGYTLIDTNATNTTNVTMYHTYYNATGSIIGFGRVTNTASARDGQWTFYGCGGVPNGIDCTDLVNFYAPMAQGPGNPNTIYFGSDVLYRSSNAGQNMTVVSQDPFDAGAGANGRVTTIGISPQNDNVRIVGLRNGKIFATTTGSSPLSDITPAGAPAMWVGRAVIDPNNSNTAYITYAGFGVPAGQHVWKTTNLAGGAGTWAPAGNGIPDIPVSAFVVDPANSNHLYAGTDIGVYHSSDGGLNWAPFGTGFPRVAVFDMAIHPLARTLRIATHGRGIWQILLSGAAPNIDQFGKSVAVDGQPEPGAAITYTLAITNSGSLSGTAVVTDTFPAGITTPTCIGYEAAAGYNASGDLMDTVLIPGFSGRAIYECATSIESPMLDLSTTIVPTSVDPGDSVTYTIALTNVGAVTLTNVVVVDPDIPSGNCDQDPAGPFVIDAGNTLVISCTNVTVTGNVVNTTSAAGLANIVNSGTVSGTSAILFASAALDVDVTASDQATVTVNSYTILLPSVFQSPAADVSGGTALPARLTALPWGLIGLALFLPVTWHRKR